MPTKKLLAFVALAYLFAWPLEFGFFALGGKVNGPAFLFIAVLCMFTPALAAVLVQKVIWREPLVRLGLVQPSIRWFLIAWLGAALIVTAGLALSLAFPQVTLVTDLAGFKANLAGTLPKSVNLERWSGTRLALPGALLAFSFVQALIAGPTVNAVAACGEELGWRGLMVSELNGAGFWRASFFIGVVWGVWHLPMVINGFNYPGHPIAGSLLMIAITVLLSPLLGFLRWQSGSVFPPAVFHGTFNAFATLVFFLRGGDSLTVGLTGVVGIFTLFVANVVLWFHLRLRLTPTRSRG